MAKNNFLPQPGTANQLFSQQPITTLSELPVLRCMLPWTSSFFLTGT